MSALSWRMSVPQLMRWGQFHPHGPMPIKSGFRTTSLQLFGAPLKSFGGCTWGTWPVAWIIWQFWYCGYGAIGCCACTIILLVPTSDSYTFESPLVGSSLLRRLPCSRLVPLWRTKIRGLGVPTHPPCLSAAAQLLELAFVGDYAGVGCAYFRDKRKVLIDIKNFLLESSRKANKCRAVHIISDMYCIATTMCWRQLFVCC